MKEEKKVEEVKDVEMTEEKKDDVNKEEEKNKDTKKDEEKSEEAKKDEVKKEDIEDELGFLPPEEISSMMNQPKEEPSNSNLGSPPKFSNATITSLHNSENISSVPSTILNHTNPIPTSVHNNNISTVQSTLFNLTNPILHQNGNQH